MNLSQLFAGGSGHEDDEAAGQIHASSSAQTDSLDALLDEIDTVLETNAESFVQGFVQKGGQ